MQSVIQMLEGFNVWSVMFRLLLATVMGGCIGANRGHHGRAAGLRTHILVCLGASMAAVVGLYVTLILQLGNDPMRIGAQVISGIGFLGAGTILTRNHSQVTGLTTAAGLWTTASIGLAVGVGFYGAAVVAFAIVMVTVSVLIKIKGKEESVFYIELGSAENVNEFSDRLQTLHYELQVLPAKSGIENHVGLLLVTAGNAWDTDAFLREIRALNYVEMAILINQ